MQVMTDPRDCISYKISYKLVELLIKHIYHPWHRPLEPIMTLIKLL